MAEAAIPAPLQPADETERPSFSYEPKEAPQQSNEAQGHDEVDQFIIMLRDMMREVMTEGVLHLQKTMSQVENKLHKRLCAVENLIAKDFAMHQANKVKQTPPPMPQSRANSPQLAQLHQGQRQQEAHALAQANSPQRTQPNQGQRLQEVHAQAPTPGSSRPQSPAPVHTASAPPLAMQLAQIASQAPTLTSQVQAVLRAQSPPPQPLTPTTAAAQVALLAELIQATAVVPPTAPATRHSAPENRRMASTGTAPPKQAAAAPGQAQQHPGAAGRTGSSTGGRSAPAAGPSPGAGNANAGARAWPASRPSFWSFGFGSGMESPETVLYNQLMEDANRGRRARAASRTASREVAPAPGAAAPRSSGQASGGAAQAPPTSQDFSNINGQGAFYISEPDPMALPGMAGSDTEGFSYVIPQAHSPPQQAAASSTGRNNRRASQNSQNDHRQAAATATGGANNNAPEQRTGFSFTRMLGIHVGRGASVSNRAQQWDRSTTS